MTTPSAAFCTLNSHLTLCNIITDINATWNFTVDLHNIASFHAIVTGTPFCISWNLFLLRIWQVIVDTSTECFVEALTPVLWPILNHPDENWQSRDKHNHHKNKHCPVRVFFPYCPFVWPSTTIGVLNVRNTTVRLFLFFIRNMQGNLNASLCLMASHYTNA